MEEIPYNYHCTCGHIAASHWYTITDWNRTGSNVISGRCSECPMKFEEDVCKQFKPDNLGHLEKLYEENKVNP